MLPDNSVLWEEFSYNPLTGELFYVKPRQGVNVNRACGSYNSKGYGTVKLNYETYLVHRIVYKWVTGREPEHTIDHKDRNPHNNRFWNLRDATYQTQNLNRSTSSSPYVYKRKEKRPKMWFYRDPITKKKTYFYTKEEAEAFRPSAHSTV